MNDLRKIVIYTRVSSYRQADDGYSLAAQERRAWEYIKYSKIPKNYIEVVKEEAKSGGSLERPLLKQLLERVSRNEIQKIIIIKLDRVSRRIVDFAELLKVLSDNNCALISINESFDFSTAWGKLIASILMIFAEFELDQATTRTKTAMEEIAEQGKYPYGGNTPIGLKRTEDNYLAIDEGISADTIRDIYEIIAARKSCNALAIKYDIEHRLELSWTAEKIARLIRNPLYKGDFYFKRIDKYYENFCPAIISKELWDKANVYVARNSRAPKHIYLFHNIVFCSKCNQLLVQETTNKENYIYYYYKCTKCNRRVNENKIIKQLYGNLMMLYNKENNNPYFQNEKTKIINKINRLKKMIENYYIMVVENEATERDYHKFKLKTENSIIGLQNKYNELVSKDERITKDPFNALDKNIKAELIQNNIQRIDLDLYKKEVLSVIQIGRNR